MKKLSFYKSLSLVLMLSSSVSAFSQDDDGEKTFNDNCGICHGAPEFATAVLARRVGDERSVLAERSDLTEAYVRVIARNGLVAMPPMTRGDVSDSDLDAIVKYLTQTK
jgi:cytochrome c5